MEFVSSWKILTACYIVYGEQDTRSDKGVAAACRPPCIEPQARRERVSAGRPKLKAKSKRATRFQIEFESILVFLLA